MSRIEYKQKRKINYNKNRPKKVKKKSKVKMYLLRDLVEFFSIFSSLSSNQLNDKIKINLTIKKSNPIDKRNNVTHSLQ